MYSLLHQRLLPNWSSSQGFSLLEVLITGAIIGIITAMVVIQYGSFNNSVLLKSQAYEMALDIREAQTFAVSVRGQDPGSGTQFREEYGIFFDRGSSTNQYKLFLDNNANGDDDPAHYDAGEEIGNPYTIDARFAITKICYNSCTNLEELNNLSISFKRPDFDAKFQSSETVTAIDNVEIVIASLGSNETRSILITATGQITVQ